MSTEAYIELVQRNLMGALSPKEFAQLNELTARDKELAAIRLEIEDSWDVAGPEQAIVKTKETDRLFQHIVKKEKQTKTISLPRLVSGIAALLILVAGALWLMSDTVTTYDKEGLFTLEDGSEVQLRAGSRLEVDDFNDHSRIMNLQGEAFFTVEKDAQRPFIVNTQNTKVEVLGTAFLVKSIDSSVYVKVEEGRVRFSDQDEINAVELTKGMGMKYTTIAGIEAVNYENLSGWKDGTYAFNGQELKDIVEELSVIFSANIEVKEGQLLNCPISAILTANNLEETLNQLSNQLKMNVSKEGQNWVLLGGECN